jgi:hypothetical protein
MSLKTEYFDHWIDGGYTTKVEPWTPVSYRAGLGTTTRASVTIEEIIPTRQYCGETRQTVPGPYVDARVTVSYDTEDRRVEVAMTVDNKCDTLTLGCNGESEAEYILEALVDGRLKHHIRHRPCFDLAIQLVKSINSNHGPNAY